MSNEFFYNAIYHVLLIVNRDPASAINLAMTCKGALDTLKKWHSARTGIPLKDVPDSAWLIVRNYCAIDCKSCGKYAPNGLDAGGFCKNGCGFVCKYCGADIKRTNAGVVAYDGSLTCGDCYIEGSDEYEDPYFDIDKRDEQEMFEATEEYYKSEMKKEGQNISMPISIF